MTELESMHSTILLNLHLMLSMTGFESMSLSILLIRQVQMSMSVLNSHLILSATQLDSFAFYYIAELTLDVECDRVGELVSLYIADQVGMDG